MWIRTAHKLLLLFRGGAVIVGGVGGSGTNSLDFSDANNSMYVALLEDI